MPSEAVIKICKKSEEGLRRVLEKTNKKIPHEPLFLTTFTTAISQQFYSASDKLFPECVSHFYNFSPVEQNHFYILVKEVVEAYTKIRLYNLAKTYSKELQGTNIRTLYTKLILFNHQ